MLLLSKPLPCLLLWVIMELHYIWPSTINLQMTREEQSYSFIKWSIRIQHVSLFSIYETFKKILHLITGSYHCSDNEEAANANQRPGLVCVSICRASWPWSLIGQSHCLPGSHWSREVSWLTGDNNWQHLSEISNWVFEGWNSQLGPRQITHYQ